MPRAHARGFGSPGTTGTVGDRGTHRAEPLEAKTSRRFEAEIPETGDRGRARTECRRRARGDRQTRLGPGPRSTPRGHGVRGSAVIKGLLIHVGVGRRHEVGKDSARVRPVSDGRPTALAAGARARARPPRRRRRPSQGAVKAANSGCGAGAKSSGPSRPPCSGDELRAASTAEATTFAAPPSRPRRSQGTREWILVGVRFADGQGRYAARSARVRRRTRPSVGALRHHSAIR